MENKTLLDQIAKWHSAQETIKIREAVLALPEQERTDELISLLARAYSNEDDYSKALELLESINQSSHDSYYCFRRGFALYCLHREHEALPWLQKAKEMGLEDIDETPGSYYPTSVKEWFKRAQTWAPRRIEQNAFEAQRRANRNKKAQDSSLTDSDFEGLWDDCDYSLEQYVGDIPTDEDIAAVETELGYRLPESYKALIKRHNGGVLARNCFENPLQRDWTPEAFSVESIYGVDRKKTYSLCGETGSKFWNIEWGYPDIGIAICDTESGGHDMIFLDYSDCGPEGEPCVVHIDQESDYEITYLADNFSDFVRGLVPYNDEDEEDD